jgi:hypothetical protein
MKKTLARTTAASKPFRDAVAEMDKPRLTESVRDAQRGAPLLRAFKEDIDSKQIDSPCPDELHGS